jgi:hypothetical protein
MILDGSILITTSIWSEDLIRPDVWTEGDPGPDPDHETDRFTDYYLRQMNFMGNVL